jgi:hypothetical protein
MEPKEKTIQDKTPIATLERKLKGHKGKVWSVAITPDGTRILSGSGDNTIGVWDAETGRSLASDPVARQVAQMDEKALLALDSQALEQILDDHMMTICGEANQVFRLVFDVKNPRHLDYWKKQPVDVYLVIRDEQGVIRWMNVTPVLKSRQNQESLQLEFTEEKLDTAALLRVREKLLQSPASSA